MLLKCWEKIKSSVGQGQKINENMHHYVQQTTKAQEEERLRIARELHDSTAQSLIAVLHQLEAFINRNNYLKMTDTRALWKIAEELKGILQEVRQFSRDLRPPILDDLGLIPAVEWLLEEMKAYKIQGHLKVDGEEKRLLPEVELHLFRIIQEALRNIGKHSQGENAWVIIEFNTGITRINIKDDGLGFQLSRPLGEFPRDGKLGLIGMQERARLIGGNLDISSSPKKGASISITVPMKGNVV